MNIIPWRRRESMLQTPFGLNDSWGHLWGEGNGNLGTHLPEVFRNHATPAVNIAETEDSFSVTMDCPGLEEEDFQVEMMGNQLLISGERKWEEEEKGKEFRRVESQYGRFERAVRLSDNLRTEADQINADYQKGVLTVTVPKLEKTPAARIPVHGG